MFAYRKYMPTHNSVSQSPGIILMRNINGRCSENMLMLVPFTFRAMVVIILFNFCWRWLDHRFSVCCAVVNYMNVLRTCVENMCSYLIDFQFSSIQFTYCPKKTFFPVILVLFQILTLFPNRGPFFEFPVFPVFPIPWET